MNIVDEHKSQHVLYECANAAVAWQDALNKEPTASVQAAMTKISYAMSLIQDLDVKRTCFNSVAEFIALVSSPVKKWLPIQADDVLWDAFGITGYAEDIVCENLSEGEIDQYFVKTARDNLKGKQNGQASYVRFRTSLIESPVVSFQDAQKTIMPTGLRIHDIYESLPPNTLLPTEGHFFPCPNCRWPMRIREKRVECADSRCVGLGAIYSLDGNKLSPLGSFAPPLPADSDNMLRIKRGIWRYTLLPGLEEIRLKAELEKLESVKVELWPCMDSYDLKVTYGDKSDPVAYAEWHVDVKDWSSPVGLAKRIRDERHFEDIIFVVPNEKRSQVKYLNDQLKDSSKIHFHTSTSFVNLVKKHIGAQHVPF